MKFSFRQILASAGGAVIAAVIASIFGVKGTIVGVAIGSAAATFGTAVVAQSIERGHQAVKQVVVRVPDTSTLLRRLGGTGAVGVTESAPPDASALTEETATSTGPAGDTVAKDPAAPLDDATAELTPLPSPATEPVPVIEGADTPRGIRWPAVAGIVAVVFVLSLMFVTAIELIAGKPLSDLFGGHSNSNAPSLVQPFESPSTTTSTSTTTTSTSTSTSTTTTTSSTTTTVVGETTTTGAGSSSSTTSTTTGTDTTTSTTAPG